MRILVSYFEPFDKAKTNSSQILCEALKQENWQDRIVFVGPLPVTFQSSWTSLEKFLAKEKIDAVIGLGQAEGREKISLECVAANWIDARIPDNAGDQPRFRSIDDGHEALWTNIPWNKLGENDDWVRSYSAGSYVCNYLMYQTIKWAKQNSKLGGFVHVPLVESQVEFSKHFKMNDQRALSALRQILRRLCEL